MLKFLTPRGKYRQVWWALLTTKWQVVRGSAIVQPCLRSIMQSYAHSVSIGMRIVQSSSGHCAPASTLMRQANNARHISAAIHHPLLICEVHLGKKQKLCTEYSVSSHEVRSTTTTYSGGVCEDLKYLIAVMGLSRSGNW